MDVANKINSIDGNRTAPVGAGRAVERVKQEVNAQQDAAATESSGVEITGTAKQLAALESSLAQKPAVDEARAAKLRNDIEQGRYKVNAEHVADQYLQLERALGRLEN